MYRPDEWENTWNKEEDWNEWFAFEAGADAMYQPAYDKGKADCLEGLRQHPVSLGYVDSRPGIFVFIPEGDNEK